MKSSWLNLYMFLSKIIIYFFCILQKFSSVTLVLLNFCATSDFRERLFSGFNLVKNRLGLGSPQNDSRFLIKPRHISKKNIPEKYRKTTTH